MLSGELERGPHAVGFRTQRVPLDPAPASGSASNPPTALTLYLWYPASVADRALPMTLADYYRAQEADEPSAATLREWLREDMTSPPQVEESQLDAALKAKTWAVNSASPAAGRFPLVLWSYRDSVPTMQVVLNEYLASHGYVVAFAWPTDNAPPLPWEGDLTSEDKAQALEQQVALLEVAYRSLGQQPGIDVGSTAVLAWSYGGESATLFQHRHAAVRIVVGIDATITSSWIFQGEEALAGADPTRFTAPYALLRNGRPRIDLEPSAEPPLLAQIAGGAWFIRFPRLSHGNFNFPGGMLPGVLELEDVSSWAVGGADARRGYEAISRATLGLIDHALKGSPLDAASWAGEAPKGFIETRRY